MNLHVLILAGGRGSRLGGVRKAELRLGGSTLLDRVIARLPPLPTPLLIATGPDPALNYPGGINLADQHADPGGPMAGLLAAIRYLGTASDELLVTVAVDTPFLPADFVARLTATKASAAEAGWRGNFYPTNAAYRLSALAGVLAEPPASPRQLLAALGARRIDWADAAGEDPFANLNDLADLVALRRRARSGDG